uniref:LsmAD domain-containing protein n=1 Tax=Arcella intermedia TaxID=1963864 RepID=A0A6B2L7T5_9EUKA
MEVVMAMVKQKGNILEVPVKQKRFGAQQIKEISVHNVGLSQRKESRSLFKTDQEIASGAPEEPGERLLERWTDDDEDKIGDLGQSSDHHWDQFEANEKLFGLKSTFQEDYEKCYTTELDKTSSFYLDRVDKAKKIASDIKKMPTRNVHRLEERDVVPQAEPSEEDRYSAVLREAPAGKAKEAEAPAKAASPPAEAPSPAAPPAAPSAAEAPPAQADTNMNPNASEFKPGSFLIAALSSQLQQPTAPNPVLQHYSAISEPPAQPWAAPPGHPRLSPPSHKPSPQIRHSHHTGSVLYTYNQPPQHPPHHPHHPPQYPPYGGTKYYNPGPYGLPTEEYYGSRVGGVVYYPVEYEYEEEYEY